MIFLEAERTNLKDEVKKNSECLEEGTTWNMKLKKKEIQSISQDGDKGRGMKKRERVNQNQGYVKVIWKICKLIKIVVKIKASKPRV